MPPTTRAIPKARTWRYSGGAIRRCTPERGGDRHHSRRRFVTVFSSRAFMGAASCTPYHDQSSPLATRTFAQPAANRIRERPESSGVIREHWPRRALLVLLSRRSGIEVRLGG